MKKKNYFTKMQRTLLYVCSLLIISGFWTTTFAQTQFISASDGGFENATSTFAANGWSEAQPGLGRQWRVGTLAGSVAGGTQAAYVGSAIAYNGSAGTTVMHFYRDVVIPSGTTGVNLNFYLRMPTTDNTWDFIRVYTTTTANTPVAGTIPGAGYTQRFNNTATAYSAFTAMTAINLTSLAGTTVRLVFTFINDGVTPHANPAIDNVTLSGTVPPCVTPPVGGTATGPSTGCVGALSTYNVSGGSGSYQWQVSTTAVGGPYTDISGAVASIYNATPPSPGTYYVRVKRSASGCTDAFSNVITTVISTTPNNPVTPVNLTICPGGSGTIGVTATVSQTVTLSFSVATQPSETNAAPGNIISTAAMAALPAGSVVTSATLNFPNITALSNSWQSDVRLGLSGAITDAAAAGTGSSNGAGNFNYTRAIPIASVPLAGGSVNLRYWDYVDDNLFTNEANFNTPNTGTLVINYNAPATVNWYNASSGGTLQGTGNPFNPVGTTVLPNTNTPGTYNFYAEGVNGSCTSASRLLTTVTVQAPPAFTTCPGNQTANTSGSCSAVVSYTTATSGAGVSQSYSFSGATTGSGSGNGSGSAFNVGTTVVSITATGTCSPTANCTFNVVVTDAENPIVTCPPTANITTDLGLCTSTASIGTPTATDNCAGTTVAVSPAAPYALGTTTVMWTATDASGNIHTCTQTVNVTDAENPVVTCPATANLTADAGLCTSSGSIGTATATDNCAGATVSGPIPAGPYSVGATNVTWTATDAAGNIHTCIQIVNVIDTENPVVTCPADANITTDPGLCTSSASIGTATATDNCTGTTVAASPAGPYPVGTTMVTWTATDASGNIHTCTQNVNVTAPAVGAPSTPTPSATTICQGSAPTAYSTFATDAISYTWAVTGAGNTIAGTGTTGTVTWDPAFTGTATVSVTANGCIDVSAPASTIVTVDASPTTSAAGTDQSYCAATTATLSGNLPGVGTGVWSVIAGGGSVTTPGSETSGVTGLTTGTNTFRWTITNGICTSTDDVDIIIYATVPAQPSVVSGAPADVCPPVSGIVLSVASSSDAATYTWVASPGTTGVTFTPVSTTNTQTIDLATTTNTTYGIRVTATNSCGTSAYRGVSIRRATGTPAAVSGPTTVCANGTYGYSTGVVTGATSYLWSGPAGTLFDGTNPTPYTTVSNSVTATLDAGFTSGTIGVAAQVACFTSPVKTLAISATAPAIGLITGSAVVCPGQTYAYSVVGNAAVASYTWTLPAGATGTSATNSINVTYGASVPSANVCVTGTSVCGVQTAPRCKSVAPGIPSQPASITGPTNGLCNQTVNYTAPSQAGVTYTWSGPSGSVINSGQGTNAINITLPTFSDSPAKTVCVTASNACGSSAPRCITVRGAPNTPAAITANPTSWCDNTSGIDFTASLTGLSGSYTLSWTYPPASVATYVIGGGNSPSLTLDWITGSGVVAVTAQNACGSGTRNVTFASTCREGEETVAPVSDALNVYPNPTSGNIHIEFSSTAKGNANVTVMDVSGRTVATQDIPVAEGMNQTQIDLSKVAKGIYMLNVNSENGPAKVKIVVE